MALFWLTDDFGICGGLTMGTGGMRCGAGRPSWKPKAEGCYRLDVRRWHREGILQAGRAGSWCWRHPETGAQTASIGYTVRADAVHLTFAAGGKPMAQHVLILRTRCTYGGARPWFGCPQCGRRVAVLFLAAGAFRCRHCASITYSSQSADVLGRAWLKQYKAEAKLNPDGSKPARMHWTTYERLREVIAKCEAQRDAALGAFVLAYLPGGLR